MVGCTRRPQPLYLRSSCPRPSRRRAHPTGNARRGHPQQTSGEDPHRGHQDPSQASRQDPPAVLPHRRRRLAHQARRPRDRGDRQVPPHRGALAHRGQLRACPVLARRRRAADRAGRRAPKITGDWQKFKNLPGQEGTLRTAEEQGPRPSASRGPQGGRQRPEGRHQPKAVASPTPRRPKAKASEKKAAAEARGREGRRAAEAAAEEPADDKPAEELICSPRLSSTWSVASSTTRTTSRCASTLRRGDPRGARAPRRPRPGHRPRRSHGPRAAHRRRCASTDGAVRVDVVDVDRR